MIMVWTLLLCLVFTLAKANVVKVQNGKIRGIVRTLPSRETVYQYYGIPYAEAGRFEYPRPPKTWTGIKNMTSFGKACFQIGYRKHSGITNDMADMSEKCLNLNIFTPGTVKGANVPVMVWIYGDAFHHGTNRWYDGSFIATIGKVIVVTINFRVGILGFLATGNSSSSDFKGNYGNLDQVEALKWVQKNIEQFGGDPNRVTIFGNSVGSAFVSLLCLSSLTNGLFKNAIMQSGVGNAPWAAETYDDPKNYKAFFELVGCNNRRNRRSCLMAKTAEELLKACDNAKCQSISVVDGHFLKDIPKALLEKGQFEKRNILLGVTNDDGSWTTNAISAYSGKINVTNGVSRSGFIRQLKGGLFAQYLSGTTIPSHKDAVDEAILYYYTKWDNVMDPFTNRRMLVNMMTDALMTAPTIAFANAFTRNATKTKTFFYQMEYRVKQGVCQYFQPPSWIRVHNMADKFVVFGYPLHVSSPLLYTRDANFTRSMIQMWTNFAKTGNPNIQGSVSWPKYDLQNQQYMALKPNMEVKSKLRADYMAFWNDFLPAFKKVLPICDNGNTSNKQNDTSDVVV